MGSQERRIRVIVRRPAAPMRTRRGFSAVELMTVIGMIGILMAILMPSVRRSFRHASSAVCKHNLHEIHHALHAYRLVNRGWLPDVQVPTADEPMDPHRVAWFSRLIPRYLPDTSVFVCPADPNRSLIETHRPPDQQTDPANASSYGMNELIRAAHLTNLDRHQPDRAIETILIADMGPDHSPVSGAGTVHARRSGGRLLWDDGYHPGTAGLRSSWLTDRHYGHINVLTIGGAVQQVFTADLMAERVRTYYGDCASGGCPLCLEYSLPHYSFASARIYWWTGRISGAAER